MTLPLLDKSTISFHIKVALPASAGQGEQFDLSRFQIAVQDFRDKKRVQLFLRGILFVLSEYLDSLVQVIFAEFDVVHNSIIDSFLTKIHILPCYSQKNTYLRNTQKIISKVHVIRGHTDFVYKRDYNRDSDRVCPVTACPPRTAGSITFRRFLLVCTLLASARRCCLSRHRWRRRFLRNSDAWTFYNQTGI